MAKTIIELFEKSVSLFGPRPFLWEKTDKAFTPTSYLQTKVAVDRWAAGLMSLGVQAGDKIALLSEGRNEWIIGELGILHTGAINVPLSVKIEESNDLLFRLRHSETRIVVVSGSQLKKIRSIVGQLPAVELVIVLDEQESYLPHERSFKEVCEIGDRYLDSNPDELYTRSRAVKGSDYANISYTSGTTSDPKGVILTHRNYTANVEQVMNMITIDPGWRTLIILPLDHCFAHVAGFYTFMAYGAQVATVKAGRTPLETLKNIPDNIREFKPHVIMSVPALAKNFKKNIEGSIRSKGRMAERLFNHALKMSYAYNKEGWNKGQGLQVLKKPLLWLYDRLLFSKVRLALGGEMRFFIGGGALLDIDLQRFYYAIGIPMLQGYGLSEATPVISVNQLTEHKLGSSGKVVHPLDLKICDTDGRELPVGEKGEIVIRGENVMAGYWKNEQASAEVLRDGWLHTGDMGYVDTDRYLYVLGRFKSLLIGSDGEKYSPEGIEEMLAGKSAYIEQVLLYNNQNAYTTALLVPSIESLKLWLRSSHPDVAWESEQAQELCLQKIQSEINQYKKGGQYEGMFPERWLPASIAVLPEPFTEQNQLMNSTMKVIRGKVEKRYSERIVHLYTPEGKDLLNKQNKQALATLAQKKARG